jgi:surface antigen
MQKKFVLAILITVLFTIARFETGAFADSLVGVKKGDWIEYQVIITGNPPQDHNITWARIEVSGVQGKVISLDIQTRFSNGTLLSEKITLNIATGVLGDEFIIPANLKPGDEFYDVYHGNITITSTEQRTVADAERTVLSAATSGTTYYWDKQTGILVGAMSSFPEYNMSTKTSRTNIWHPQILGIELLAFYTLTIAVIVTLVVALAVLVRVLLRRQKQEQMNRTK